MRPDAEPVAVKAVLLEELAALALEKGRPLEAEIELAIREWLAMSPRSREESEFMELIRDW